MEPVDYRIKSAIVSKCGNYRYALKRIWNDALPTVLFIMLNPSTADAGQDDPTIRRCVHYAKSWGYGGMFVGNLFAYRSTDPKNLLFQKDPVGKKNGVYLKKMSKECEIAICAWGNTKIVAKLMTKNEILESVSCPLYHLALTLEGTPKHPLYLKKDLQPMPFDFYA